MTATTFPEPYQSVFRDACFTLAGIPVPEVDINIRAVGQALPPLPLGVKRIYTEGGEGSVNVAPYLRRLVSPEPLCGFSAGMVTGVCALFVPVRGLIVCAAVFVAIDFATGVAASHSRARRAGLKWTFSSRRAWDTVTKLVFVMAGIALAWMLDSVVFTFVELHLAKIFTGFVCGVEFCSYLENAADITGQPLFRALKKLLKRKVDETLKK